ncbi:MAG: hypothetical protein JKX73_02845, partial [Flavobacteriales bacterium]|nr:hypothetical protein [Flavobacteriales bacterium]
MNLKTYLSTATCLFALLSVNVEVQATIDSITTVGFTFSPANITITSGDTVRFYGMSVSHPVAQDASAWVPFTSDSDISSEIAAPGTYPYYCTVHGAPGSVGMSGVITVLPPPPSPDAVWINEFHYDNAGADQDEGVEIAGPAGTDLTCFEILIYNGGDQLQDPSTVLSGTIPDEGCGFGTVWFPIAGLQNGAPDGIGLYDTCNAQVNQFLSYEGSFTALDGPAVGLTSVDIGVSEQPAPPAGESLQLIGTGSTYPDFTWTGPTGKSPDLINNGQRIYDSGDTNLAFVFGVQTVVESAGTASVDVTIFNPSATDTIWVDVVATGGTAVSSLDYTFTTQTLAFPPGSSANQSATVTIINDTLAEADETIILELQNPNGATYCSDSIHTITIPGNDASVAPCANLFFSEYFEGSSNNKALELYNPTSDSIDLGLYTINT